MPRATNPGSGIYQRLYGAGVTSTQIRDAINSGLDPLQMPPEYYGLNGGYTPNPVGPGANPVNQWGVDIPTGASGPTSGEIPTGLPGSGSLTDIASGSIGYGPTSLTDVASGSGPSVSASSTASGSAGITNDNPFAGATATGSPGSPFAGATATGSAGNPFAGSTANAYNYYDAGNGTVYLYDENWNYVGTTTTGGGSQANQPPEYIGWGPGSSFNGGNAGFQGQPVTGAGPYAGGNMNPSNPGYVAPGVGPQGVVGGGPTGAAITTLFSGGQHNL